MMQEKVINHLRNAVGYRLVDRNGLVGHWLKWSAGGWLPVVLRNDLWKAYL